jgi:antitoxin (DNA-binding transcriptional repressor) of toxin-antitoxin stability system
MMSSGETLVIERHGRPIGFFVPVTAKDRRAGREALGRLGHLVEQVLDETGLDEDALADEVSRRPRR